MDEIDMQGWLEAVIKQHERRSAVARILSYEERNLVEAGDNYMSQVKKVVVRVARRDGEIITKSFILKRLPPGSQTQEMIHKNGFNFTEFTFYRDVLTSMENLFHEKGLTDEPLWPQCISLKPYEKIMLEDLTAIGYKMGDRNQGLDFDHCSLAMQNLGMFHALGLVMKERGVVARIAFGEHFYLRLRNEAPLWLDKAFKKLLASMDNWGDEWKSSKAKLEKRLDTYVNDVIDMHAAPQDKGLTVLVHGDSWVNNMVFKYNVYTGKPILMRFLDFQLVSYSSPALDLIYFFVGSISHDVRRNHKKELLKIYHDSLVFNMERLGVNEKPPTFEYIECEMKRLSLLNIHYMTNLLPIIHKKKGEAWNVEDMLDEFKKKVALGNEDMEPLKDWLDEFDEDLVTIFKLTIKEVENDL